MHSYSNLIVKRYFLALLVFLCPLIYPQILKAETWYVDNINDCSGTGSFDSPFCKIEDAVTVAVNGDTIFVKEGIYEYSGYIETSPIILKPGITLKGENVDSTIIYGDETWNVVGIISGADNSIIDGFTFNGTSVVLPIMCDSTSPTIQNCIFDVSGNGVICKNNASPLIRSNKFYSSFINVLASSSPVIQNNVIVGNYHYGITITDSSPTIENNTIAGNGTFGIMCSHSTPVIKNNIITYNGQYGINCGQGSSPEISYNLVSFNDDNYYDCEPGTGDITGMVFFADPENGDYHVMECSSSIDMGDPSDEYSNEPEPNGGRINLGAYGNTPEATVSSSSYSGPKYVDCNIETSGDGSSPENAFKSIKEAMYIASAGDTIYLSPGTYTSTPDDPIYIKSGITLQGEDKATTIIAVEPRDSSALKINGENIILKNLTIKGLLNTGCEMHCYDSSIEITDCYFENVEVRLHNSSQSIIHGNTFYESPLILYSSDLTIKNNLFNSGGIYLNYSSPEISNNTLVYRGIGLSSPSFPVIKNNIIAWSDAPGISCYNTYGTSIPVLLYNNLWRNGDWRNGNDNYKGCESGAHDISIPPSFINESENDFHLQRTSQCVDAGDPSSDFSNEPAPNGGRINLGAYGNTTETQTSPTVKESDEWYVDSSVSESGDGTSWATAFKTITAAVDMAKPGNTIYVASGTYYEKPIIYKPLITMIGSSKEDTIIDGEYHQYIAGGPFIGFHILEDNFQITGFTIRDSPRNISLDGVSDTKLQELKIGGEAFIVFESIELRGATNTIIENCEIDDSTLVESSSGKITIKNNVMNFINIRSGDGFIIEDNQIWGGVYINEASNVIISNNLSSGVSVRGENIKVTHNIVLGGVGFNSSGTGLIANNIMINTPLSSPSTGILVTSSSTKVLNNTVFNFSKGIGISGTSSPEIINNLIFKKDFQYSYGIEVSDDSNPVIKNNNIDTLGSGALYSGIEDQTGISGNIAMDTNNLGDFSLLPGSVCIDKGDNSINLASLGVYNDVYGNTRVVDGDNNGSAIIDIGAVEQDSSPKEVIEFSLKVGNSWTYNGIYQGTSYILEREVIELDETTFSVPSYVVETRIDGIGIQKSWYRSENGKLILFRDNIYEEDNQSYNLNYRMGLIEAWIPQTARLNTISTSLVRYGATVIGQSYIYLQSLGLDSISLESGDAEAYKVLTRKQTWLPQEENISNYTQWIVPYVGVMKSEGDDYVEELVSFSLENGTITESSDADNDGVKDYLEIGIYKTDWKVSSSGGGGGGGSTSTTTDEGGGGGGGGGIFGTIDLAALTGYHLDWKEKDGTAVYMPVTDWIRALKGAQTHVESFAPGLARFIREQFDALERKAKPDQDGFLSKAGTYLFPVFGKIAEMYLYAVDSHELMDNAYKKTTISIREFNNLEKQRTAVSSHLVKENSD
ncbi:MAG: right-handed parallel beta-helix repeat-containing protein [Bacteroidales bacterium]|nr:right-handed parallel beta-helix repeat-containing protein [Bacteroidales bacterium]